MNLYEMQHFTGFGIGFISGYIIGNAIINYNKKDFINYTGFIIKYLMDLDSNIYNDFSCNCEENFDYHPKMSEEKDDKLIADKVTEYFLLSEDEEAEIKNVFEDEVDDIMRNKTPISDSYESRMSTPTKVENEIEADIISDKEDLIELMIKSIIISNKDAIKELSLQLDHLISDNYELVFFKDKNGSILFSEDYISTFYSTVRKLFVANLYYSSKKVLTPIKI